MDTLSIVLMVAALLGGLLRAYINGSLAQKQTIGDIVITGAAGGSFPMLGVIPKDISFFHAGLMMFGVAYVASDALQRIYTGMVSRFAGPLIPPKSVFVMPIAIALLAGCATTAGQQATATVLKAIPASDLAKIDHALDQLANHGLIQLAATDAADTQKWVDAQAATLGPIKTAQARVCPTMVALAGQDLQAKIQALRDAIKAAQVQAAADAGMQGPEVILFLTQLKFGASGDPQANVNKLLQDVGTRLDAVVQGCLPLFPTKQVNELLNLIGQTGLTAYMPALAPFIAASGGPLGGLMKLTGQ